jgi:serine/threonine-protein kinase
VSAEAAGAKAATTAASTASGDSAVWQAPGYRHERELGTGANGRVVSALHEGTSVAVTITYLSAPLAQDDAFRAEFRADADALGGLAAPHVAQLHAYVEDGPHAAIVREPVDGVALDALLGVTGALSPEASLTVFKGSLLALDAAHEAGVLHRAYRPDNVLVTADGSLKVVDFGVALRGGAGGAAAGQDAYTAPERVAGGPATVAADLYAATAVLRECLTGAAATAPAAQSRLPETVRPLIAWGWAGNPAERPESAADFAAELETAAVAAYGADWEERGRRELVALVAPLLAAGAAAGAVVTEAAAGAQPPAAPVAAPAPPSALPGTGFGDGAGKPADSQRRPRFGRRAKILAVAVAAVVVAGAVAITAAASGNDKDSAAPASPVPGSSTPLTSAPVAPSATATTAPVSPTSGSSASATASATAPAAGTASPSRTATADPTGTATSSPSATTTPSSSVSPTATSGSAAGPHVASVAVTGFACSSGSHRTASATVLVQYDGTAAGTLHLTWWRSATGSPQGAVMRPQQTAHFPKGAQSYTFTDSFTFTPDGAHPYVGLSVSTDPGAASGNGSYKVGCH